MDIEYHDLSPMQQVMVQSATANAAHSDTDGITDDDEYFIIDTTTRKIINKSNKSYLIQYDHHSERLTFKLPRYIEGHDMMNCNKITVNYLAGDNIGLYEVDDLGVESPTELKCSWLISSNVTQDVAKLFFALTFECVQTDGEITYKWNTDINEDLSIKKTIANDSTVVYENVDILEQWKQQLIDAGGGGSVTVDSELSSTSENPVQNKVVNAKFNTKIDKSQGTANAGKVLSVGSDGNVTLTTPASGSDITVDSALSTTSTNPVQNKIVNAALTAKLDKSQGSGNAGKLLSVGSDGNITFTSPAASGGGDTVINNYTSYGGTADGYTLNSLLDGVEWIEGTRLVNGVEQTNATYCCTDYIEIPENFDLSFYTTIYQNDLFFYDDSKTYISKATTGGTIPANAKYIRLGSQNASAKSTLTQYGNVAGYQLQKYYRQIPEQKLGLCVINDPSLIDVITDPTKQTATINFYGDSNTYGYGVDQKSWAYYIAQALKANYAGAMKYYVGSPYVQNWVDINSQALPAPRLKSLTNQDLAALPYIRIQTTAASIKVGWVDSTNKATGQIIIDDDIDNATTVSNGGSVVLDGSLHWITLKLPAGNYSVYNPYFEIEKTIVCNNYGVAGRTSANMECTDIDTCDYAIVMIGTNDNNNNVWTGVDQWRNLNAITRPQHVLAVMPPANRTNATLMRQVSHIKQIFEVIGCKTLDLDAFNALVSVDSTLMQSDGLHYTAKGHMMLANYISSYCGAVCNVWDTATYDVTVADTFANIS